MRDYKRGLVDGAEPFLGAGEQVRVIALAQESVPPWAQFLPYVLGGVGFAGGFGGGAYLPTWLGVSMVLFSLATAIGSAWLIRRRMLVRTDENLYVFKLPATRSAAIEAPLAIHPTSDLRPASPADKGPVLDNSRIYPSFGASGEKEPICRALDPNPIA